MTNYEVIYADLVTGVIGGIIPADSFTYESVLSAPGSASFSLKLSTATTIGYRAGADEHTITIPSLAMTDLAPWRTAVFVERDGVVVWSGIISTAQLDVKADSATINAVGWHAYWRKRILRESVAAGFGVIYQYLQIDQAAIARSLINHAQSIPGGNIGIDTSEATLTGVKRDRVWYAWDRENVGQLIENLAATEGGFDFAYVSWRDEQSYRTAYRTLYPRTGRATNIVFRLGVNVDLLSASVDGDSIATQVEAVGSGEANAKVAQIVRSADTSYPLLEEQVSYSDVVRASTLLGYARQRLTQGAAPIVIPTLSVRPSGDPPFGSYSVGDSVAVQGSHGLLAIDGQYRITTIGVKVDGSGEDITLSVAPLEIFG